MTFTAATADQVLAIRVNAGIEELAGHDRFAAASPDMVEAIVEGIGQFAAGEFAPLTGCVVAKTSKIPVLRRSATNAIASNRKSVCIVFCLSKVR